MCGRYVFVSASEALKRLFDLDVAGTMAGRPDMLADRYNIAPGQEAFVVRAGDNRREPTIARWGLVPGWASDPAIGNKMINARSETAREKPAFRAAFARRRCLVPATGFYEWLAARTPKQPHYLSPADGVPLAFAGLWEEWRPNPEAPVLQTFTILTAAADERIAWLHHRVPVVVPPAAFDAWLSAPPDIAATFLTPPPAVDWTWHAVSRRVNAVVNDTPDLIAPWQEPQGSLF